MQPLLKFNPPPYAVEAQTQLPALSLKSIVAFLRRSWPVILLGVLLGTVGGLIHLHNAVPVFVARTQIAIDPRGSQALPENQSAEQAYLTDTPYIQTQVGLLKSESVILAAIGTEKLLEDEAFMRSESTGSSILPAGVAEVFNSLSLANLIQAPLSWFQSIDPDAASDNPPTGSDEKTTEEFLRERGAIEQVLGNLQVEREGLTNIIEIRYSSHSPQLPARIANAVARAYISDQLNVKFETSKVAAEWLQQRITELREQSAAASRAVQDFRTSNNLIETSRGRISEQKLGELNSQLVQQQVATAEAKARLDRIIEVAASGVPDPATVEVLRSEIITRLRNQYLDLSQREAEIANRLGQDHPVTVDNRRQMAEIRKSMSEELNRIIGSARSDYEVALTRQKALEDGVTRSLAETAAANQAQVTLRELESSEQALKSIYEAFLRRYTETIQTQSFPVAGARVITAATPPLRHSYPRPKIVMAISVMLGFMLGLGAAAARDRMRNVIRFPSEVREQLGYDLFGVAPRLPGHDAKTQIDYAAEHPASPFTENLRGIMVALQIDRAAAKARTVAIVSANHGEGKTVFAANLAWVAASMGLKTLVIDGDLRSSRLSSLLTEGGRSGLGELLTGTVAAPADFIVDRGAYHVLPAGSTLRRSPSDLLGSARMTQLMQKLEADYDIIIVDLPPTIPLVDARIAVRAVSAALFLIAWNKTDREGVLKSIKSLEASGGTIAGCVLTKTSGRIFSDLS
jgi:succinoglycan biosynthesis transport protein ExoP